MRLALLFNLMSFALLQPLYGAEESVSVSLIEQLMAEAEYERAGKLIPVALKKEGLSDVDRIQLYLFQADCFISISDEMGAKSAFKEILQIQPAFELSPLLSPKVLSLFQETKKEFSKNKPVIVPLALSPPLPLTVSKPIQWPYWVAGAASLIAGVIVTSILLSSSKEGNLRLIIHPAG